MAQTSTSAAVKNVVFVHGAWADGSGWGGSLQDPGKRRIYGRRRSESDHVAEWGRSSNQANDCQHQRARDPSRPFIRRGGDHGGTYTSPV
jgi:hypothetical protein